MKIFKRLLTQHQVYWFCTIAVPEGEGRDKMIEKLSEETMTPNLVKETDIEAQEAENSEEDKTKEAYTRTLHNENAKS